ncbi:GxGYxYP domain-containing protein [Aureibacillus halotolerans]|uniref:GxGYxY motif-containing protein n=1 Tax=Aureibacillus halotolerans TaxID=1508390 RepID=A0A4R6U6B0_9BACI|nr:GxGYxYP domain-containing protein [Aureibacillus halotolerans]TDQ42038.1 GxGYxY motif-containing protein [Aureibacillus halotolerans]
MGRKLLVLLTTIVVVLSCSSLSVQATANVKWPKHQALPTLKEGKHLDVIDLTASTGDEKLLFTTLQGNVNREKTRIYIIEEEYEEGKTTWLDDLGTPYTMIEDKWTLFKKYKDDIAGLIIYDPAVRDSINVATTLAGLEDAVVVDPVLAEKLSESPYNFKVIKDLRGQFEDRLDAYQWQYEQLWPKASQRMLVGLSPTSSIDVPDGNWDDFEIILQEEDPVRDSSNQDTYELDVSRFVGDDGLFLRFQDAFPSEGWGPAVHQVEVKADGEVIASFVPGTPEEEAFLYDRNQSNADDRFGGHRWADAGAYFVYQFPVPPDADEVIVSAEMWNQFKVSASNSKPVSSEGQEPYGYLRDYAVANRAMVFWLDSNIEEEKALFEAILSDVQPNTPYLGWFGNDVAGEFSSTELVSRYGVYVVPADWFSNMTVFSAAKSKVKKQKSLKAPALENKIYLTFTLGEGDNLQYNQHRLRVLWDDPNRGSVPINWSISPLLVDAAPSMLRFYQDTATKNDLLIAGPSGAGYIYPTPWPDETFPTYAKQTAKYMKKTGLDIIYALNRVNEENVPLSEAEAQDYIDYIQPRGLFLSWEGRADTSVLNEKLPQSILYGASSVDLTQEAIEKATADWDESSPLFISMGMLSWSITPSDIQEIVDSLGAEYEVVRGDQYFDLIREHEGLPRYK